MEKETLKRIFDFLETKEEHNMPFKFKLIFNEPLTKEELNVKGYLNLSGTHITSFPEGLKVGGDLNLRNCKNLKSLLKGFKVSGFLSLKNTNITSLPEDLKVGKYLNLKDSKITSLPKGLEVDGNLYIREAPLIKYTDDQLREMIKPGFIKGEIYRE